jgi:hypothetical protein
MPVGRAGPCPAAVGLAAISFSGGMRDVAVATVLWSAVAVLGETCRKPQCLCDDSCRFSGDGVCDDSGPGVCRLTLASVGRKAQKLCT